MTTGCGSMRRSPMQPRIFFVSVSILCSSPSMNGITLPRMSHDGTPGYPAPEIACSVAVLLACGARARAEPCDAEPRMVREQSNELLADHSGRAKDADFYPFSLHVRRSKKKPTRREPCRLRDGSVETGLFSARSHSDTTGPLSADMLARGALRTHETCSIERDVHEVKGRAASRPAGSRASPAPS